MTETKMTTTINMIRYLKTRDLLSQATESIENVSFDEMNNLQLTTLTPNITSDSSFTSSTNDSGSSETSEPLSFQEWTPEGTSLNPTGYAGSSFDDACKVSGCNLEQEESFNEIAKQRKRTTKIKKLTPQELALMTIEEQREYQRKERNRLSAHKCRTKKNIALSRASKQIKELTECLRKTQKRLERVQDDYTELQRRYNRLTDLCQLFKDQGLNLVMEH
jgi:hypothetical protein